jgi:hypothetical protein
MYDIMWAFLIELDKVAASVAVRKSAGAWAKLFAQAESYVVTELLSSTETHDDAQFVTIDRWKTTEDFA